MTQNLTKRGLAFPQVHINGTSKEGLCRDLQNAALALQRATEALQAAPPHGRDYYVQTGDALALAQSQHRKRLESLHSIREELTEIWEAVDAQ